MLILLNFTYLRAMFKSKLSHNPLLSAAIIALLTTCMTGCASIGNPGGGLYDETPPTLKNSTPSHLETNVKKGKITMHFDENIKLDKATEKITVSPPQIKAPIIMSNAKTLTIDLGDTLKPNTTYSIDLGNAVQDNNEGNPLEGLSILFSTGDHIDSLRISGYLLNAEDLEPITGAYVGIYRADGSNDSGDSLLIKTPFERAGKTDETGAFSILGCAPGQYRLYSLTDGNTNYRYDLTTENISFIDTLITPSLDSMQIVMLSFNEGKVNRYLDDCSRPDSVHISIRFAAYMDSLPQLQFLMNDGSVLAGDSILIADINPTLDTLTYWIKDSLYFRLDTLNLALTYMATDTAGIDRPQTDTIPLIKPIVRTAVKQEKPAKKGKRVKKLAAETTDSVKVQPKVITYMTIKQKVGATLEIGQKPQFEVSAPLDSLHLEMIHLQYKQDTLWTDMSFHWVADSLHPCIFTVLAEPHYNPGYEYQLVVDSAAMHDIYGNPVNLTKLAFKEKKPEDYAHLLFNIEGLTEPAFVQLLNQKDEPVQQAKVIDHAAKFIHVPAGEYYARIVIDSNQNGRFDTGNLFEHVHPEKVYYFNAKLQLRANWTVQQTWNVTELPLIDQKPKEVKKNKPKEPTEKKSKNEEYLRKLGKI